MELVDFVDAKRSRWAALEALVDRAHADGLRALSLDDARQLSRLYRGASSDLLWIRAHGGSADVAEYLNDLVGRAYAVTYPGKKARVRDVWGFIADGFPALLRAEWRPFVAAWLLFLGGAGFGYLGMAIDPNAAYFIIPGQHMKLDPVERAEQEAAGDVAAPEEQAQFAAFLWQNNIQVSFLAFALGITAGVGTALLLFGNGILLGSLFYVYLSKGMGTWFWAWILPHGIPEITAICISGAAGLVIARGMLAPGGLPRRVALRRQAMVAVKLELGTILLFVLAGVIEATISQIHPPKIHAYTKLAFAIVVGVAVYAYLLSAWLRARAPRAT